MTDTLKVEPLSPHTYIHISYLDSPTFGKVPCNGLIYKNGKQAVVFDTPSSDPVSVELIKWIRQTLRCEIKAIVINHFHSDCLGGLKAFHEEGIPSYANAQTIELAKENGNVVPQIGFEESDTIMLGNKIIVNRHFGEGHTRDNIVSYLPLEEVIFGGCLIKEVGAGKGNLADANTADWPNTVRKIKGEYPQIRQIVPGHGKSGGAELLDYTIGLFEE